MAPVIAAMPAKGEPLAPARKWHMLDPEIEALENQLGMLDVNDQANRAMFEFRIADLRRRRDG